MRKTQEPKAEKQDFLTDEQLKNLGFHPDEKVIEPEFSYQTWTQDILGVWMEVTNDFGKGNHIEDQTYEINQYNLIGKISKDIFLGIRKLLNDAHRTIND